MSTYTCTIPYIIYNYNYTVCLLGFLHNELEKVGIEIRQPANIAAPEPQQLIDLEVIKTMFLINAL